jgi:hypothetical protein
VNVRETSLGKVSVVHRPLAASSQCSCEFPILWCSFGIPWMMSSIGSLRRSQVCCRVF